MPANFSGMLMPEWQFRMMNAELVEKELLETRLSEIPVCEESKWVQQFLIGVVVGSAAVMIINRPAR